MSLNLDQYHYSLPSHLIANNPSVPRDACRLLCLQRNDGTVSHHRFTQLPGLLPRNSVLVFNQTKVFPARLLVSKPTGGRVEILFIIQSKDGNWLALASPRPRVGLQLYLKNRPILEVIASDSKTGHVSLRFLSRSRLFTFLSRNGQTPLPPYIKSSSPESLLRRQYQSIFAKTTGSAAAPTASLHFTGRVLKSLHDLRIPTYNITLHVGLGTFAPLTADNFASGTLHCEPFSITPSTIHKLNQLKSAGYRIIAVGTTTARCLESASSDSRLVKPTGETDLFIRPGYKFKFVDGLVTNFHLPQSSLLMLVSAFVSNPNTPFDFSDFAASSIGRAYKEAIVKKYRFFSFGDAMLII